MRYYLSPRVVLKWLETPCVYDIACDELYELDEAAFGVLKECAAPEGCRSETMEAEFLRFVRDEGIVTEEPAPAGGRHLIRSPRPSLRYLELQITDNCNLRCRHCYLGPPGGHELPLEELGSLLREFEEMQGLRLLITGGEPLMHSRFEAFNDLLPDHHFRKVLFTNGLLLHKRLLDVLNVDEIQFSVDGMKHGHDAMRGRGTYERVMEKIRDALATGTDVSIATMIHKENLDEFEEMEAAFRQMGIKDWTVDAPCPSGNLSKNLLLHLPPEVAGPYLNYGFGEGLHGGGEGFACGLHLLSVMADGRTARCAFYAHLPVGTVREGLRASWARVRPMELKELDCFDSSCEFLDACRGGCRYRASIDVSKGAEITQITLRRDFYKCCGYGILSLGMKSGMNPEEGRGKYGDKENLQEGFNDL